MKLITNNQLLLQRVNVYSIFYKEITKNNNVFTSRAVKVAFYKQIVFYSCYIKEAIQYNAGLWCWCRQCGKHCMFRLQSSSTCVCTQMLREKVQNVLAYSGAELVAIGKCLGGFFDRLEGFRWRNSRRIYAILNQQTHMSDRWRRTANRKKWIHLDDFPKENKKNIP